MTIISFKKILLLILSLALLLACTDKNISNIGGENHSLTEEITNYETLVDEYLNDINFSGSVLVAKSDVIYISKGYGMAEEENNIPNEKDTKHRIASLTKPITAFAIMQLHQWGKLDVNDTIDKYLPYYPNGEKITIHHLLTNTSGILNNDNITEYNSALKDKISVEALIEMFIERPLLFEPGSKMHYSNSGFIVLGAIIEEVSGLTYGEYLKVYVFDPLEMHDTGYNVENLPLEKLAVPNVPLTSNGIPHPSAGYSSGGLHSTVEDLYKWDKAIRNYKLIDEETTKKMFTPYKSSYAYGWRVFKNENEHYHSGGGPNGYASHISSNKDTGVTVILLTNSPSNKFEGIPAKLKALLTEK